MKKNRGEGAGRRRLVWPVWEEEYEREFMEISSRLEGAGVPANWADNAALQLVKLNRAFDRGELGDAAWKDTGAGQKTSPACCRQSPTGGGRAVNYKPVSSLAIRLLFESLPIKILARMRRV